MESLFNRCKWPIKARDAAGDKVLSQLDSIVILTWQQSGTKGLSLDNYMFLCYFYLNNCVLANNKQKLNKQ